MTVNGFEAVIFDFGGVLTSSPLLSIRAFAEQAGIAWELLNALLASREGAWARYEMNALTQDEFIIALEAEAIAAGFSIDATAFLSEFFRGMALRDEMLAVVRALRPRLKVGCITNNVQSENRQRSGLFDELFDIVVESSKVGMRKPEPAIYLLACTLLGVQPEQAIFLDDFGVNLKAARTLGMTTIKVDETRRAVDELEQILGVTLP